MAKCTDHGLVEHHAAAAACAKSAVALDLSVSENGSTKPAADFGIVEQSLFGLRLEVDHTERPKGKHQK
jgi:hypothetical protein